MTESTIPIVDPDDIGGEASAASIVGVLLAAGTSSRFGDRNKLLESIDSKPIVRHAAQTLVRADLDGVTVVLGHQADRVREAISDLELSTVVNESYEQGQSTSVRTGVRAAADRDADAVLVALGDMPAVTVDTVDAVVAAYRRGEGDAIAAAHGGQRGNPVLFDSAYFEQLTDVTGDIGGRQILLSSDDAILLETADPGVLRDIDRPEDIGD